MANIFSFFTRERVKGFFRRKLVWTIIVIIVLIGIYSTTHGNGSKSGLETDPAAAHDIVDVVSQTGSVTAVHDMDLAFLSSGQIANISVKAGDQVKAGQVLASLKNVSQEAAVESAQAQLVGAQAKLEKLQAGTREVDKDVLETSLQTQKDALAQTKEAQDLQVESAHEKLFSNDLRAYLQGQNAGDGTTRDYTPPTISGTYGGDETGNYIVKLYPSSAPSGYSFRLSGLETGIGTVQTTGPVPLGTHGLFIQFPTNFAHEADMEWVIPVPNTRSATYLTYKNAYDQALQTKQTTITQAENALNAAQAQYNQGTAAPESEDVRAAEAAVDGAQAGLLSAEFAVSGTVIVAPFAGTVTKVVGEAGETASPSVPVVSMISADNYQVEVYVPEADIANVSVGDPASITFDAYDKAKFPAKVVEVAPNAEDLSGVTSVKVTLQFLQNDPRIKVGLSADVDITAARRNRVLAVLGQAVIQTDIGTFVRVLKSGVSPAKATIDDIQLVPVETGLRGSDGYVEITSGLKPGDQVVTLIPEALRDPLDQKLQAKIDAAEDADSASTPGSETTSTTSPDVTSAPADRESGSSSQEQ
ncbi:MAG TPA: efflux RND transporter periplasmic adaptor subunit [Candidatus Paceibacterota bacterium]|nr:efflux RND transporter periplasmic adaptor subunit [Candidatus Paceibacterota bacterium]